MAGYIGEKRPQWAETAYEAIAPVYDEFTAHHDTIPHHPLDEIDHTKGVYIARAEATR